MKNLFFCSIFAVLFFLVGCKTEGCTDQNAVNWNSDADTNDGSCTFEGKVVFWYGEEVAIEKGQFATAYSFYVDGELVETATWPTNFVTRRFYLFWKYELPDGQHSVEVKILNPSEDANVLLDGITIYGAEELASN